MFQTGQDGNISVSDHSGAKSNKTSASLASVVLAYAKAEAAKVRASYAYKEAKP